MEKLIVTLELSPSSDGELDLTQSFKFKNSDQQFTVASKVFYKELSKKLQLILDKSAKAYKKGVE